jgi:hypothetical protein
VTGSAGSSTKLLDAEWLPVFNEGAELLKLLRTDNQPDWTLFYRQIPAGPRSIDHWNRWQRHFLRRLRHRLGR